MKRFVLLVAITAFTLPAVAQNYDYCMQIKRWDVGGTAGRTRCGYIKRDDSTCTPTWTSDTNTGIACWEQGADLIGLGCTVYDQRGTNAVGDLEHCKTVKVDKCYTDPYGYYICSPDFTLWLQATPDDGDGL